MKLTLRLLIALLLLCRGAGAQAALALPGEWTAISSYTYPVQDIIETSSKVFYLAGGFLYSYDKNSQETYSYTVDNMLTEADIASITYNDDRKYLLIAYSSGSIDLLYDSGEVVSLPDIADAQGMESHDINQVAFDGYYIYAATPFGIVKFDERKREVVESGIYNKNIPAITISGDYLVIAYDSYLWTLEKSKSIRSFDSFSQLVYATLPVQLYTLPDGTVVSRGSWPGFSALVAVRADFAENRVTLLESLNPQENVIDCIIPSAGCFYYQNGDVLCRVDHSTLAVTEVLKLPQEYMYNRFAAPEGLGSVWAMSLEGVAHVGFSSDGRTTVYSERMLPDALSVRRVCLFIPSPDGNRLYITTNANSSSLYDGGGSDYMYQPQQTSMLELDGMDRFEKREVYPVEVGNADLVEYSMKNGPYAQGTHSLAEDPDDPDTYFISTSRDGIYKVKGRTFAGRIDHTNSPIPNVWGPMTYGVNIDRAGNMWVFGEGTIMVLPVSKRRTDPSKLKPSDWKVIDIPGYSNGHDVVMLECRRSNMIFIVDHMREHALLAIDTKGTYDNLNDDTYRVWTTFTDQDGKQISPQYATCVVEDMNGHVWLGTEQGVLSLTRPDKATDSNMTVTHLKVPRNDGTNNADYLLGSDAIQGISVDRANRKWIATKNAGLYLVNAAGNEVLRNFNSTNSILPSDNVFSVYANPFSTDVYVGTASGMYVYGSDATAPADDYSDIYAYPNPVRPEYTGQIYVKGLMDNSLVKIADSKGNVVAQGRSEGGMFIWDGCNFGGRRVPTGVYYIFASQNASGSGSGAVAKVMVID